MTSYESCTKRTHVLGLLTQYIEYIRTLECSNYYYIKGGIEGVPLLYFMDEVC